MRDAVIIIRVCFKLLDYCLVIGIRSNGSDPCCVEAAAHVTDSLVILHLVHDALQLLSFVQVY